MVSCINAKGFLIILVLLYFILRPYNFKQIETSFLGKLIILLFIIFCVIQNKYCGLFVVLYIISLSRFINIDSKIEPMCNCEPPTELQSFTEAHNNVSYANFNDMESDNKPIIERFGEMEPLRYSHPMFNAKPKESNILPTVTKVNDTVDIVGKDTKNNGAGDSILEYFTIVSNYLRPGNTFKEGFMDKLKDQVDGATSSGEEVDEKDSDNSSYSVGDGGVDGPISEIRLTNFGGPHSISSDINKCDVIWDEKKKFKCNTNTHAFNIANAIKEKNDLNFNNDGDIGKVIKFLADQNCNPSDKNLINRIVIGDNDDDFQLLNTCSDISVRSSYKNKLIYYLNIIYNKYNYYVQKSNDYNDILTTYSSEKLSEFINKVKKKVKDKESYKFNEFDGDIKDYETLEKEVNQEFDQFSMSLDGLKSALLQFKKPNGKDDPYGLSDVFDEDGSIKAEYKDTQGTIKKDKSKKSTDDSLRQYYDYLIPYLEPCTSKNYRLEQKTSNLYNKYNEIVDIKTLKVLRDTSLSDSESREIIKNAKN